MTAAAPPPRRIGPYRLDGPALRGGMGEVYRAWDERLDRPVALKRLRPAGGGRRELLAAEARALAAVEHPAVVRVHDLLEHDGESWLVLEWLEGETLAAVLRRGPLAVAEAVEVGRRVAAALAAAHARGLVHRDLKAENVLRTVAGEVKVLDLGLAGPAGAGAAAGGSGVAGTPRCLAPELLLGRPPDAGSDLFALGVLLYEALAGRSPFLGGDDEETLARIARGRPRPLAELRPEVPAALASLVGRLLAGDPAARPSSAAAVAAALDAAIAASPAAGDQPTIAPGEIEASAPGAPRGGIARRRPAHRRLPALLAAGLVAAAAGVVVVVERPARSEATSPAGRPAAAAPRVAIAAPEVAGASPSEGQLLADALRLAALRALVAAPAAAPLPFDAVDDVAGRPIDGARAAAADELLVLDLACGRDECRTRIERVAVADGVVRAAFALELPTDDAALAARAVEARVLAAYGGTGLPAVAAGGAGAPLAAADYRRFLALWRRARSASAVALADEALPLLESIRGRAPRFLDAYLLDVELRRKRWGETGNEEDVSRGLALADAAAALFPERPEPREERALLLLDAGRADEARRTLAELALLAPGSADLAYLEARAAEAGGDPRAALAALRRLVAERPSWRRLYALAHLELRQGRPDLARHRLHELLARVPASYEGRSLLAQVELLHGDPARAAALYAGLVAESPGYAERTNLGLAHLLAGDWGRAVEALEAARALDPESPFAILNLADAALLAGDGARAAALYREVLRRTEPKPEAAGESWQTWSVRAQALAHLGRGVEAVEALRRAQALAGDHPQADFEAALVYTLVGDLASAVAHAGRARAGGVEARWFELPFFAPLPPLAEPRRG